MVIFGFPLSIYPVNQILESWTIDRWIKPTSSNGCLITSLKNVQRLLICLLAAYLGINCIEALDVVLALIGATCGAPLAMLLPTLLHLKSMAKTKKEKVKDLIFIVVSCIVLVFCMIQVIFKV